MAHRLLKDLQEDYECTLMYEHVTRANDMNEEVGAFGGFTATRCIPGETCETTLSASTDPVKGSLAALSLLPKTHFCSNVSPRNLNARSSQTSNESSERDSGEVYQYAQLPSEDEAEKAYEACSDVGSAHRCKTGDASLINRTCLKVPQPASSPVWHFKTLDGCEHNVSQVSGLEKFAINNENLAFVRSVMGNLGLKQPCTLDQNSGCSRPGSTL